MKNFFYISLILLLFSVGGFLFFIFKDKGNERSIKDIISDVFKNREDLKNSEDRKNELMKEIGVKKLVFLVLGMDYNWVDGHKPTSQGARSDTIILVTMDLYNQEVRLLSIPRDLRVYYDEFGYYEKINAAVVLGGPSLTRKIISNLFGVHIDYVFIIKQQAIKNLVDSVGGVYIDVEKDMFYEDKWGNLRIDLKHGRQLLNGEQVIGYMRFRMDEEGDLGRMRRQNQAISQIMQQLPSKINSSNIFSVINNVLPYVQTDMKKEKIMLLINFMANFSIDYKSYKLLVEPVDIDGVSYVELKDYKETVRAWYRGYEKLGILNACSADNNMEIFNKYIYGSNFYLNASDYLDDYVSFSVVLQKDDKEKSSLYYKLPFGKTMTLKEFIYHRYVNSASEIYLKKSFLYDNEISKLRDFYVSNDVVLILGEDSIEK